MEFHDVRLLEQIDAVSELLLQRVSAVVRVRRRFSVRRNDDDNRIYDAWIDGVTDGKSGSTVGYMEAPFAERRIVHSGKQSMPLTYDNSASFSLSEAELTFGTAQNWTSNGADSFVLWFRGVPHALGDLLGMPSVMQPAQAWAMNDLGEVLCTSGGAQVAPAGSAWIMSPTQRAADLNGDCRVDGSDIGLLLQSWGARGSIAADLDHDGSVDGADLGLLLGAWSGR